MYRVNLSDEMVASRPTTKGASWLFYLWPVGDTNSVDCWEREGKDN